MLKKRKVPHTYVIVFYIIVIAAIATWIIPGGEYVKKTVIENGQEHTQMVFQYVDHQVQTWQIFSALFKGFERQSGIIVFILMIGGAFWIMNNSKAIDVGIYAFLRFTKRIEKFKFFKILGVDNIIITLIMILFSAFGAIFGMSEETIAFIIIFVPLSISMGYDSIVGVSMCFVAAGLGFAGAILNPFTIGIAQGLAELPLFSGIEYRLFSWLVINAIGITFILRYARKIKKNPKSSLVYEDDAYWRKRGEANVDKIVYKTTLSAWIVYGILTATMIVFSIIYPQTELKVGNSSSILPIIPIVTGIFALTGFLSLRKSAHFFVLN
ncbi:MAG: YfcC family protein, partial [Bacteroidetes bacterium]